MTGARVAPTMVNSSQDLRGVELPRGRGYARDAVDEVVDAALSLVEDLEQRVRDLSATIHELRSDPGAETPDLVEMLTHADPDTVVEASATAAGEVLAEAVFAGRAARQRSLATIRAAKEPVLDALGRVVELAEKGRSPNYELTQLALVAASAAAEVRDA